ncbi:MAG: hypothetical protein E4G90_11860 [Gemmatimonadales bacterium]|nr:MAG: hypothetical protein E4G90_11860 [Gemmatimonadales bacterium]
MMLPLVAMQFSEEVNWDGADFAIAGVLLFGTGLAYQLLARRMASIAYRAALGVALAAALLLVWVNGAVGIIGSERNDANLMYAGVLAAGVVGAIISRFQPRGMARALFAMALAQASVAAVGLIAGFGSPESGPLEIMALNGVFVALFLGSALLFRKAEQGSSERGAV